MAKLLYLTPVLYIDLMTQDFSLFICLCLICYRHLTPTTKHWKVTLGLNGGKHQNLPVFFHVADGKRAQVSGEIKNVTWYFWQCILTGNMPSQLLCQLMPHKWNKKEAHDKGVGNKYRGLIRGLYLFMLWVRGGSLLASSAFSVFCILRGDGAASARANVPRSCLCLWHSEHATLKQHPWKLPGNFVCAEECCNSELWRGRNITYVAGLQTICGTFPHGPQGADWLHDITCLCF